MSSGAAPSHDWETRQARMEERVSGLEGDLKTVLGAVTGLGEKLDRDRASTSSELAQRGKTNWTPIVAIASVAMTGMVYLGSQWREPLMQRHEAIPGEITALRQAVVPRAEATSLTRQGERDNDLIRARIEKFEARVTKEVERLNSTVFVPAWSKRS